MKKLFVMFSLSVLAVGSSYAQEATKQHRKVRTEKVGERKEAKTPEERAAKRVEMLTKKYNLTQAQQSQLQALFVRRENEVLAKRTQRATRETKDASQREVKKAQHSKWESELQSILTSEQYAQYQADKKAKGTGEKGKDVKKGRHLRGAGQTR